MRNVQLFSKQQMRNTPSARDGISLNEEVLLRAKGCNIICHVGAKLCLPQVVILTACTLLHRFYMANSLRVWHHYNVAAIALFSSCKIEENLRRLEDFIPAFSYYASKQTLAAQPESEEYRTWQKIILGGEIRLLGAANFELVVQHPYETLLSKLVEQFRLDYRMTFFVSGFINDCYKTPAIVLYESTEICIASIVIALQITSIKKYTPAPAPAPEPISTPTPNLNTTSGDSTTNNDHLFRLVEQYMITNNIAHSTVSEIINWILVFYTQNKPLAAPTPTPP